MISSDKCYRKQNKEKGKKKQNLNQDIEELRKQAMQFQTEKSEMKGHNQGKTRRLRRWTESGG